MKTDNDGANESRDVFAAPQKIAEGLMEAFEGFAKMFEGISDQLAALAEAAEDADEQKLFPMSPTMSPLPDKPAPALAEKKNPTVKRPRKTPGRKPKPVEVAEEETAEGDGAASTGDEDIPAPTDADAPPETDADWPPDDTPPWEDMPAENAKPEPPKPEPPKADSPKAEPKPTPAAGATITKDDIRSVIVAKIKQKRNVNEKVQSLLAAYGVKALSDLPEDKHEAFLADISQL